MYYNRKILKIIEKSKFKQQKYRHIKNQLGQAKVVCRLIYMLILINRPICYLLVVIYQNGIQMSVAKKLF